MIAAMLLFAALASFAWFLRGDRAEYARMKALVDTRDRQRRFASWTVKGFMLFGVLSIAELALLGRADAPLRFPAEFAALADTLGFAKDDDFPYAIFAGAALGGGAVGALIVGLIERRRHKPVAIGEFDALLPRNRAELAYAALLSVNAGLSEELFFRLLIPLLVTMLTGSAIAGFVFAAILFGLAHLYQGWKGIAATFVLGLAMTAIYLFTQSLIAAIVFHAIVDLNALVVRPILTRRISLL